MTRVLNLTLRLYRIFLSPLLTFVFGKGCKFHPTCSVYAMDALRKHGVLKGGRLALTRVLKCNPFSFAAFDPVPSR